MLKFNLIKKYKKTVNSSFKRQQAFYYNTKLYSKIV